MNSVSAEPRVRWLSRHRRITGGAGALAEPGAVRRHSDVADDSKIVSSSHASYTILEHSTRTHATEVPTITSQRSTAPRGRCRCDAADQVGKPASVGARSRRGDSPLPRGSARGAIERDGRGCQARASRARSRLLLPTRRAVPCRRAARRRQRLRTRRRSSSRRARPPPRHHHEAEAAQKEQSAQ